MRGALQSPFSSLLVDFSLGEYVILYLVPLGKSTEHARPYT